MGIKIIPVAIQTFIIGYTWSKPSKAIGNFRKNMLIHPEESRGFPIRETAKLQSFPDNYIFLGSIGFQQQQVADAVPPLLADALGKETFNTFSGYQNETVRYPIKNISFKND